MSVYSDAGSAPSVRENKSHSTGDSDDGEMNAAMLTVEMSDDGEESGGVNVVITLPKSSSGESSAQEPLGHVKKKPISKGTSSPRRKNSSSSSSSSSTRNTSAGGGKNEARGKKSSSNSSSADSHSSTQSRARASGSDSSSRQAESSSTMVAPPTALVQGAQDDHDPQPAPDTPDPSIGTEATPATRGITATSVVDATSKRTKGSAPPQDTPSKDKALDSDNSDVDDDGYDPARKEAEGAGGPPVNRYRDVFFSALYGLFFLGVFVLLFVALGRAKPAPVNDGDALTPEAEKAIGDAFGVLAGIIGGGFILTLIWFFILRCCAGGIIWVSLLWPIFICLIVMGVGAYLTYLYQDPTFVIPIVCALILLCFASCIIAAVYRRLPQSIALIQFSLDVLRQYPGLMWIVVGVCFSMALVGLLCLYTVISILSSDINRTWNVWILAAFIWSSYVIKYTAHVTTAGVFGTHMFLSGEGSMPVHPTLLSVRRAVTYSFGSVCFGSFLCTIYVLVNILTAQVRRQSGFFASCVNHLVKCLESCFGCTLLLNHFAFVHVALHGDSFIDSTKEVIHLLASTGLRGFISELVVANAFLYTQIFVALCTGGVGVGLVFAINPTPDIVVLILAAVAGLLIGYGEASVVFGLVHAGVSTIIYMLARYPESLKVHDKAMYKFLTGHIRANEERLGRDSKQKLYEKVHSMYLKRKVKVDAAALAEERRAVPLPVQASRDHDKLAAKEGRLRGAAVDPHLHWATGVGHPQPVAGVEGSEEGVVKRREEAV